MQRTLLSLFVSAALLAAGCTSLAPNRPVPLAETLASHTSGGPLALAEGQVLTDNDAAFAAKLEVIASATESLDLAYYIFADDYSSTALTQALLDATRRGVRVRLLLDYFSAYRDLDRLSWLEREGAGKLEVRLYNRPTAEIIRDAAYLTTSCADVGVAGQQCDDAKQRAIEQQFGALAAAGSDLAETTVAGSGLFLSGLYGKHPQLLAYAISRGQGIDPQALAASAGNSDPAQGERLKELGKLYFKARYSGGVDGLSARLKLAFVRLAFAEQVNPVFATVGSYLPLARQNNSNAQRDWDYLSEFLHHKLLLADRRQLVLGGRNVEDAYHLHPGPLSAKYNFMDTDVRLRLTAPDATLAASFDNLWQLPMNATLAQVRRHAPNEHLANFAVFDAAQETCAKGSDAACVDRYLARHLRPLEQRMETIARQHRENLQRFRSEYRPAFAAAPQTIDAQAAIHYLQNLPMVDGRRSYGAPLQDEAAHGKQIHGLWRSAMQAVCDGAGTTREVYIHNAYFFLPANLLRDIGGALDGSRACPGVTLTMLTNSLATTDLSVVNLLAVWQMKALADHLRETAPGSAAARLRYYEYLPQTDKRLSLHSKVMVFGDDVFIGSANADVRSLMMDSNNGVFIRNAPAFAGGYRQWLRDIVAAPGRVAERTADLGSERDALLAAMDTHLDQLLARYAGERLSAEQQAKLRADVRATTQRVYDLSRGILRGERDAAEQFNALFKAI